MAVLSRKFDESKIPADVLQWLEEQSSRPSNLEGTEEALTLLMTGLENGLFASKLTISEIVTERVNKAFKKGRHTKMMSKKMCAKIHGKTYVNHMPLKQTALFTQIQAKKRKSCGFTFTVVNYFDTLKGYVYALRFGHLKPHIYMFTGHFFDRFLSRQMNTKDHAARMQAVFRLMRYMDQTADGLPVVVYGAQCYMKVLGGLCVGVRHAYKSLPTCLDFVSKVSGKDEVREVYFFLTYISKEMLRPEQLWLYEKLLIADVNGEFFKGELIIDN